MKTIASTQAPAAIGPYSQAIEHNGTLYISGQVAFDPNSMQLVGTTADEQCHQVFKNLSAVLNAAGSSLEKVLKAHVFLLDMADFAEVNAVYAHYFGKHKPARECIAVKELPAKARVEISVIAYKN